MYLAPLNIPRPPMKQALNYVGRKGPKRTRGEPQPGTQAYRAIQLRMAVGPDINSFTTFLGIKYRRWHNIERGWPLSLNLVRLVTKRCPGIPPEWLLYGISINMGVWWQEKLFAHQRASQGRTEPIQPLRKL